MRFGDGQLGGIEACSGEYGSAFFAVRYSAEGQPLFVEQSVALPPGGGVYAFDAVLLPDTGFLIGGAIHDGRVLFDQGEPTVTLFETTATTVAFAARYDPDGNFFPTILRA